MNDWLILLWFVSILWQHIILMLYTNVCFMFDRSTSCLITITNYFIYSYLHYLKNILHHHLWIQLGKHICAILCLTLIFLIDLYYLSDNLFVLFDKWLTFTTQPSYNTCLSDYNAWLLLLVVPIYLKILITSKR